MEVNWPKIPPVLNAAQLDAREKYMKLWHEELPKKYAIIERFNHGYVSEFALTPSGKTLEVGAGIGEHLLYERLAEQDYHCLEYREEFTDEIRKKFPLVKVHTGDIHQKQIWEDESFDRIVAIHVLEHLCNLPLALNEMGRLLKPNGHFDIVIPCEGGMAHTFARKISAQRLFEKNFKMDFTPIHKNEHVNTFKEIMFLLLKQFKIERQSYFPLLIPISTINLCAGFRLVKKK
jgi:2-polyprenyl-3-methyl-5-hydroxy-6-metoxy-1,4-benzoquinol methylase